MSMQQPCRRGTAEQAGACTVTSEPTTAPTPALTQPTTVQQQDQATVTAKQLLLDLPNGCANTDHKATSSYTFFFCVRRTVASLFGGGLATGTLQVNFA